MRTSSSSGGPVRLPHRLLPTAAPRSTSPSRSDGATAPATPAASRSPPARVRSPSHFRQRLPPTWQADAMPHLRSLRVPTLLAALLAAVLLLSGCGGGGDSDEEGGEVAAAGDGAGQEEVRRRVERADRPVHEVHPLRRQRRARGQRRPHPGTCLQGRREGGAERPDRDCADHLGGRQGLREAPPPDEVHRDRSRRVRRTRPGRLRRPRDRVCPRCSPRSTAWRRRARAAAATRS